MSVSRFISAFFRCFRKRSIALIATSLLGFGLPALAQTPSQVGFWYKPTEPGWGVSIQQQGTSTFAVWFTYDAQAKPIWYTLSCTFATNVCAGDLYTGRGLPLAQITAGANLVAEKAGTGAMTMTGSGKLNLSYTIGAITQTKTDLEAQNFVAAASIPVCQLQGGSRAGAANFTDHWWGGASRSGWGLQISHQADTIFFGWYSYNDQGTATWNTGIGKSTVTNPNFFSGSLYQIPVGTPFSSTFSTTQPPTNTIGSFTLNFGTGDLGTFVYSLPQYGIEGRALAIERLAVAGGLTNLCTLGSADASAKKTASRFLSKATFGPRMSEIDALAVTNNFDAWIDAQIAKPQSLHLPDVTTHVATLAPPAQGQTGFNWSIWKRQALAEDQLRQRIAFALSEIFVVSNTTGTVATGNPRGPANYLDMLGANAFTNYRKLMDDVTYSPMMGIYLTYMRNQKENAATGAVPDENYARELMQLMTIGLYQLNLDGSQKLDALGRPIDTYANTDISNLAKVFTGLSWGGADTSTNRYNGAASASDPNREIIPMQAYNQFHSVSAKQFLGVTIPATTVATANANADVKIALDTLFNHPNVGPFIGKQLIQRLVTSNPSPSYVARVATAFNNNGAGVRGDMPAVIKAVLLDPEALTPPVGNVSGKLREPAIRFVHWMRSFNVRSQDGRFLQGTTLDPGTQLAQMPMYAPSVFNFFRPGFVPPNSKTGAAGLVAPEAQIASESSTAGYLNFMRATIQLGIGTTFAATNTRDIQPNYAEEIALASDPDKLVDRVELLLMGGTFTATTRAAIRSAVTSVTIGTANPDNDRRNRVYLAIFLAMAAPEYILQR